MSKITWVNFLHIYQPPWQEPEILKQITRDSYQVLIQTLRRFPHYRISLNLSGALTEQLMANGLSPILYDLNDLAKAGQIEFVGSAMYHPILPLLTDKQIVRQIKLQEAINKKYLSAYKPTGFFLPEMAYSERVAKLIKRLGYGWLILDQAAAQKPPTAPLTHPE